MKHYEPCQHPKEAEHVRGVYRITECANCGEDHQENIDEQIAALEQQAKHCATHHFNLSEAQWDSLAEQLESPAKVIPEIQRLFAEETEA